MLWISSHCGEHMLHQKHLLIMQLAFWTYSKSSRPSGWHMCLFEVPRLTTVHEPHTTPSRTTNAPGCAFKIVAIANLGWWQSINPFNTCGILFVSRIRFMYGHHTSKYVQQPHKQVKTILFLKEELICSWKVKERHSRWGQYVIWILFAFQWGKVFNVQGCRRIVSCPDSTRTRCSTSEELAKGICLSVWIQNPKKIVQYDSSYFSIHIAAQRLIEHDWTAISFLN